VRLGGRGDPPGGQSGLARSICRDHLVCLAAIATLLVVQLAWAPSGGTRGDRVGDHS
jgi:hypothetical protein